MYKKIISVGLMSLATIALLSGCSDDSSGSSGSVGGENDIVYVGAVGQTGFLNLTNLSKNTSLDNSNGVEIPATYGVFVYKDHIYTSGSMSDDKLIKYSYKDNIIKEVARVSVGEGSMPTSYSFVSDTKAYISLVDSGELLVINPSNMSVTKRIDLSSYAMGENDTNPEPGDSVIRDGKLYLGLVQVDSRQTFQCRDKASLLIIDTKTDEILKHITDDRTCGTTNNGPRNGIMLDEKGDIYVNNTASFGYKPGVKAGYLRIKKGETEFDPDYFLSVSDATLDIEGKKANYACDNYYDKVGKIYTVLSIPGLTSTPPDYMNDKNFQPYMVDLYNKTFTKLDLPASSGFSALANNYKGEIIYALDAAGGTGFFKIGSTTPDITTEGTPMQNINLN